LWQTGVILYTLAFPTVLTSNLVYFFDLPDFLRNKFPKWAGDFPNQSYYEDIHEWVHIRYYRHCHMHPIDMTCTWNHNWQNTFIDYAHLLPLIFLVIEFAISRVQMLNSVRLQFTFLLVYFSTTAFMELLRGMPS
jgi:hypothetical protein